MAVPNEINEIAEKRRSSFAPFFIAIGGFILGIAMATALFVTLKASSLEGGTVAASLVVGVLGFSIMLDGFRTLKRREATCD